MDVRAGLAPWWIKAREGGSFTEHAMSGITKNFKGGVVLLNSSDSTLVVFVAKRLPTSRVPLDIQG